jgi:hypothetical protein
MLCQHHLLLEQRGCREARWKPFHMTQPAAAQQQLLIRYKPARAAGRAAPRGTSSSPGPSIAATALTFGTSAAAVRCGRRWVVQEGVWPPLMPTSPLLPQLGC